MSIKTYYFFRCKTSHELHPGLCVEAGTFIGNGGRRGVPFERAQMFVESTLKQNIGMYFSGHEHWEIVSVTFSENDLKPVNK